MNLYTIRKFYAFGALKNLFIFPNSLIEYGAWLTVYMFFSFKKNENFIHEWNAVFIVRIDL